MGVSKNRGSAGGYVPKRLSAFGNVSFGDFFGHDSTDLIGKDVVQATMDINSLSFADNNVLATNSPYLASPAKMAYFKYFGSASSFIDTYKSAIEVVKKRLDTYEQLWKDIVTKLGKIDLSKNDHKDVLHAYVDAVFFDPKKLSVVETDLNSFYAGLFKIEGNDFNPWNFPDNINVEELFVEIRDLVKWVVHNAIDKGIPIKPYDKRNRITLDMSSILYAAGEFEVQSDPSLLKYAALADPADSDYNVDALKNIANTKQFISDCNVITNFLSNAYGVNVQVNNDAAFLVQDFTGKQARKRKDGENDSDFKVRMKDLDELVSFTKDWATEVKKRLRFKTLLEKKKQDYHVVLHKNVAYPYFASNISGASMGEANIREPKYIMALQNENAFSSINWSADNDNLIQDIFTAFSKFRNAGPFSKFAASLLLVQRTRNAGKLSLIAIMVSGIMTIIGATTDINQKRAAYGLTPALNGIVDEFVPIFQAYKTFDFGRDQSPEIMGQVLLMIRDLGDNAIGINMDAAAYDLNFPYDVELELASAILDGFKAPPIFKKLIPMLRMLPMTGKHPNNNEDGRPGALSFQLMRTMMISGAFITPEFNFLGMGLTNNLAYKKAHNLSISQLVDIQEGLQPGKLVGLGSGDDVTIIGDIRDRSTFFRHFLLNKKYLLAIGLEAGGDLCFNFLKRDVYFGNFSSNIFRATIQNMMLPETAPDNLLVAEVGNVARLENTYGDIASDVYGLKSIIITNALYKELLIKCLGISRKYLSLSKMPIVSIKFIDIILGEISGGSRNQKAIKSRIKFALEQQLADFMLKQMGDMVFDEMDEASILKHMLKRNAIGTIFSRIYADQYSLAGQSLYSQIKDNASMNAFVSKFESSMSAFAKWQSRTYGIPDMRKMY